MDLSQLTTDWSNLRVLSSSYFTYLRLIWAIGHEDGWLILRPQKEAKLIRAIGHNDWWWMTDFWGEFFQWWVYLSGSNISLNYFKCLSSLAFLHDLTVGLNPSNMLITVTPHYTLSRFWDHKTLVVFRNYETQKSSLRLIHLTTFHIILCFFLAESLEKKDRKNDLGKEKDRKNGKFLFSPY